MLLSFAFSTIALLASASATGRRCQELVVPVEVQAPTYPLAFPPFANGYEATAFLVQATKRTANPDPSLYFEPVVNLSTTFSINVFYCAPKNPGTKSGTVQLLSHGVGTDHSYWDFPTTNGVDYSYITSALSAGYSVLAYDGLGVGLSSKPNPYNVIQSSVELAILATLTSLLRTGQLSSSIPVPKKVVHVGHSFGSVLSNALVASRPDLSDGLVLTGFSHSNTWASLFEIVSGAHLARENQPARFGEISGGFLTWGNKYDSQYLFFTYPFFDTELLEEVEARKSPFTVGELLTRGLLPVAAPGFTGPVLISKLMTSGLNDQFFCGGDCIGIIDGPYSLSPLLFSNASTFDVYLQPNTGHAMNLHFNATGWYGVVSEFLGANGL